MHAGKCNSPMEAAFLQKLGSYLKSASTCYNNNSLLDIASYIQQNVAIVIHEVSF